MFRAPLFIVALSIMFEPQSALDEFQLARFVPNLNEILLSDVVVHHSALAPAGIAIQRVEIRLNQSALDTGVQQEWTMGMLTYAFPHAFTTQLMSGEYSPPSDSLVLWYEVDSTAGTITFNFSSFVYVLDQFQGNSIVFFVLSERY